MHHLYFAIVCLLWGSNFILMNRAGLAMGPVEIALCRLLGGGVVLAVWWRITGHQSIPRRCWPDLALVALFGDALPFVLQPFLIAQGFGHSYFGVMVAFVPVLTMLCSIPMLGVWPRWNEVVGVVGGLVAMILLMWDGQTRGMSLGVLAAAFTVPLAYAVCNTYIRRRLTDVPPVPLTTALLLLGALFVLPMLAVPDWLEELGIDGPEEPTRWPTALASVAWMAAVGTGVSIVLFMSILRARGPLFAGMVSYPVPLIALAWGAFDREPITMRQLVAIVVVLAMVALVQWGGRQRRPGVTTDSDAAEPELVETR